MEDEESLITKRIEDFIVDEIIESSGSAVVKEHEATLKMAVENEADLAKVKQAIEQIQDHISENDLENLELELEEISDDLEWKNSQKGKSTIDINQWVSTFQSEYQQHPLYQKMSVGSHAEKPVVYICGSADSQEEVDEFTAFIQSKNPPLELLVNVEIK